MMRYTIVHMYYVVNRTGKNSYFIHATELYKIISMKQIIIIGSDENDNSTRTNHSKNSNEQHW